MKCEHVLQNPKPLAEHTETKNSESFDLGSLKLIKKKTNKSSTKWSDYVSK